MIGNLRHVGKLMIGSVVVWHASILIFATSQSFYFSFAVLTITGAGFASTQVFLLSALLGNSKSEYRGHALTRIPDADSSEKSDAPESVMHAMIAGLKYVKGQQVLWGTLVLALIIESSGWTFHTTLMPIFARNVLDTDSTGLGFLLFAFGIGAVAASLGWAMIPKANKRNPMLQNP